VRETLVSQNVRVEHAEATMMPKTTVELDDEAAEQVLRLVERLEELDDVQRVFTNAEFSEQVLEKAGG
jgi:transcriptional/translational regulatory protein YebC/TACO1